MKIHHVALYVRNLIAARDFFVTYFGGISNEEYHNPTTGFRSFFLRFQDGSQLEIMTRPNLTAGENSDFCCGYAHLAFSVGSREAVDRLTRRLQEDGYALLSGPRVTGDGCYESCVAGIEGNRIEITI